MNSVTRLAAKIMEELGPLQGQREVTSEDRWSMKAKLAEVLKKKWGSKVMHGQYIINMDGQLISEEDSFLWLSKEGLKAETESEIFTAQYQALHMKYYGEKKSWKRRQTAHAGSANNLMRQYRSYDIGVPNTWKEQYIKSMIEWVHSCTTTSVRKWECNWIQNTGTNMCHNQ